MQTSQQIRCCDDRDFETRVRRRPTPEYRVTDPERTKQNAALPKCDNLTNPTRRCAMMDPKLTMDVPPQVREFAKKSVDQAEKAVSTFLDSASKSVAMAPGPMTDVAKQALAVTEKNLKASFEHARKLMQAKDINEIMQLQSEFLRNQFGTATEQFKVMTSGAASGANDDKEKPDLI